MKTTIKLYDFERNRTFPTAESVCQLEQIFGIDRVPWPEIDSKLDTIDLKITQELKSLLRSHGKSAHPYSNSHYCQSNDPSQFR